MKTLIIKILVMAVVTSAALCMSGCAAFKNTGSGRSIPSFAGNELATRIPATVFIIRPELSDFSHVPEGLQRNIDYSQAIYQTDQLLEILQKVQMFDSVRAGRRVPEDADIVIRAKPFGTTYTDPDSVWVLWTLGVIPYHEKSEVGICFDFIKGGTGNFKFEWQEEMVLGFWAPFLVGFSKQWSLSPNSDKFWKSLRSALVTRFAQEAGSGNATDCQPMRTSPNRRLSQ